MKYNQRAKIVLVSTVGILGLAGMAFAYSVFAQTAPSQGQGCDVGATNPCSSTSDTCVKDPSSGNFTCEPVTPNGYYGNGDYGSVGVPAPSISSVTPNSVPGTGGPFTVKVTGSNFIPSVGYAPNDYVCLFAQGSNPKTAIDAGDCANVAYGVTPSSLSFNLQPGNATIGLGASGQGGYLEAVPGNYDFYVLNADVNDLFSNSLPLTVGGTSGGSTATSGGSATQNSLNTTNNTLNSSLSGVLSGWQSVTQTLTNGNQSTGATSAAGSSGGATGSTGTGSASASSGSCTDAAATTISTSLQTLQSLAGVLSSGSTSPGVLTSVQNLINAVAQVLSALANCISGSSTASGTGTSTTTASATTATSATTAGTASTATATSATTSQGSGSTSGVSNSSGGASIVASPSSGSAPLSVAFDITSGGGNSTQSYEFNFWWNCSYAGNDLAGATAACGATTNATSWWGNGCYQSADTCSAVGGNISLSPAAYQEIQLTYKYKTAGTYFPKVIITQYEAPNESAGTQVTVN